ncbi:restriction endonuclease subunit S [Pseudomonas sp. TMP25]|uniref:restriction endonuclease subunit S n=1 Tax=Pseudomonas sp. TMP25 TaxID=3136561 RepID=UPI003100CCA5
MNKDTKKTLLPALRFPEFQDTGEWGQVKLRELAKRINAKNRGSKITRVLTNSAADGIVDQRDYFDKDIANQNNLEGYFVVDNGDYVYNPRVSNLAPVGPISKNGLGTGVMSPIYSVFRFKNSDNRFYEQYFKTPNWHNYLRMVSNSGARHDRMSITHGDLMDMPLPAPCTKEQQKIADFLSSIDVLISAQDQKVEALKAHKKGLMQKLFPQEGETGPRLRFPDFLNAGEWEEVALGEIAEIKLGKMLDKQKHTKGRLLPYLNNMSVRWNEVNTSNLPQMYFADVELDRFGLKAGDVVVCEGGEPGRAAVWDGRLPDIKFQKAIHRVRFNVPFDPRFLVLHLENLAGTTQFEMLFTGGGIKHLTMETFAQLKIPLIPHAEQQKIADCLSSIDALISGHRQKLDSLKTHKKGLIQVLFPAAEAGAWV